MDIATGIGLIFGFTVFIFLMMDGGGLMMFASEHAGIVIFGGATAATMIRFPFSTIMHGLPLAMKHAFTSRRMSQRDVVDEITRLAEVVRKSGPIALENETIEDEFLAKGMRMIADGYDRDFIRDTLERDRDNTLFRLDEAQKVYRAIGDCAPAFGMVGTLVGMVQMFANMDDPSKLGPFMATALLATLYGAVLANLVCMPIADKVSLKAEDMEVNSTLIIDGVLAIRESKSPTLVRELLMAYLPEHSRHEA
ncbi:MAG: motility protein A, partial [Bradyrhizobium sp.]